MKTRMRSIAERAISYGLILVALFVFGYFYTVKNQSQRAEIDARKKEFSDYELKKVTAAEDLKARQAQIEMLNNQLNVRRKEVEERFEQLLTRVGSMTDFINEVHHKAQSLGVTIQGSKYDPPQPAQGAPNAYLEFRFTLDVTGAYEKAKRFLWEMENTLGRFVKISKMSIKPPICDAQGNMNLSLTLTTYFLP